MCTNMSQLGGIPYTCRSSRGTLKFGQQLAYLCKLYIPLGNSAMMMMADSSQMRIFGKVDGQFLHCLLVAIEADSRCAQPTALWARRRFGLKMIGMLLALSASCVFPLHLHVSLPRTYKWLFSLMSANCLGLRSPAAMTDGWFPPVEAASSAGLCNAFLEHHKIALSFLELAFFS